jgi:SAM-dependent methyltransferase
MSKQERLSLFLQKEQAALAAITEDYQGFSGLAISGHEQLYLPRYPVQHVFHASNYFSKHTDCQIDYKAQPFPNEYFDLVILYHVFDETDEISMVLKEAKRILRHDGILLISGFERMRICARVMQQRLAKRTCVGSKRYGILDIQSQLTELQFKLETYHFDFCKNKTLEKYLQNIVPFLGIGFWIKAQKEVLPLNPLIANSWELDPLLTPINTRPEYLSPQKQQKNGHL